MLSHLWSCIRGPRVYRIYTAANETASAAASNETEQNQAYPFNPLEHGSQQVIKGVNILVNISLYVSPIVLFYLWKKDYSLQMAWVSVAKLTAGFTLLVLVSMAIRGIGRSVNPSYRSFLQAMREANLPNVTKKLTYSILASKYDCDFWALPITYDERKDRASSPELSVITEYFMPGGFIAHLFGRHLIYPGSVALLQAAFAPYLEQGRSDLINKHSGTRAKVRTSDGNDIDTIFVDRRNRSTPQGSTLVVCCEGNAGFYEVGIASAPIAAGYSVLGWNTPGFAYSTGLPFPRQVQCAADAVMQFAITKLNFTPDNVIVYGWSIGGYPAAWLAKTYPEVRGLVLDATFDHLLPLALPRMPGFMGPLVCSTISQHFDLCTGKLAAQYYGPVTVIRRMSDEIITTVEGDTSTNRANELLEMILESRYPQLFSKGARKGLAQFIRTDSDNVKSRLLSKYDVSSEELLAILSSHYTEEGPVFPSCLGENNTDTENTRILLFLATKLMVEVEGGHTNPLDAQHFKQPWSLVADSSFVQVE